MIHQGWEARMPIFGSDQLRCSLVQDNSKPNLINYVMSRADGTILDEIDIGQEEWPHIYPKDKKFFNWRFIDNTKDMRAKVQRIAMQEAFNSVQKITALRIDYEKDINKKTDITIEWLEDIKAFGNKLSVLAQAWLVFPNSSKNGVIEFNDSPESKWYFTPLGWSVPAYLVDNKNFFKGQTDSRGNLITRASQSSVKICMHEFGHTVGLRHDLINKISVMYPSISRSYNGDKIIKESFYWDKVSSIPRLTERYGSSNIFERILDRWRGRRTRESTYER